jgi:hypothetical protein
MLWRLSQHRNKSSSLDLWSRVLAGSAAQSEICARGLLDNGREPGRVPRILSIREASRFYPIREISRFR